MDMIRLRLEPTVNADAPTTPNPGGEAADQHLAAFCPRYHEAIELIGRRWNGAILRVLLTGCHRFQEIQKAIPGLSDRLLAERLRELESAEVVLRQVIPGPPIRAEYRLSPRGRDLEPVITSVAAWAEKWLPQPVEEAPGVA
jgi:DNA-binding HxlR family transcriptional regulator